MKKTIHLIWVILVSGLVACEDAIDLDPISSYSFDNMWQTREEAEAGTLSIYTAMQRAFDRNISAWGEARAADHMMNFSTNTEYIGLLNNTLEPSHSSSDWGPLYQVVSRANYALHYIPRVPDKTMNERDRNTWRGEAYFARALAYFYIVRIWGAAPLIVKPVNSTAINFEVPRTAAQEIWKRIEVDLDSAELLLPVNQTGSDNTIAAFNTNRARATQPAVWALKTDYYMWQKNYPKAIESAAKFETSSRYFDPATKWKLATRTNWPLIWRRRDASIFSSAALLPTESIFEVYYNTAEGTTHGTIDLWHRGSNHLSPNQAFMNLFTDPNDIRSTMYSVSLNKVYKFKGVILTAAAADAVPNDHPIILYRLPDVLLMRAEAHNRNNEKPKAIELLNAVRTRAGVTTPLAVTAASSTEAIENEILNERARELLGEGKRWWDLRRTGKVFSTLGPISGITQEWQLLWPINQNRLNENPALGGQNPGYSGG